MKRLENEVLLSRRGALAGMAAFALGSMGVLAGCGSDEAKVSDGGNSSGGDSSSDGADAADKKQETKDLPVGTAIELNGLTVVVNSVQAGLTNYDGSVMTGINVTYTNNGDEGADYNVYDWKGEDAQGAQQSQGYYSEGSEELQSGTLAQGGTVTGNIYFDGEIAKALYFGNVFDKNAAASWVLA